MTRSPDVTPSLRRVRLMLILGHAAFSVLTLRAWRIRHRAPLPTATESAIVVLGALLPDLIDKPLAIVDAMEFTRSLGHSLWLPLVVGLFLATPGVASSRVAPVIRLLLAGLVGHHVCDLVADLESGLLYTGRWFAVWMLWPWVDRDDMSFRVEPALAQDGFLVPSEMVLVMLAGTMILSSPALRRERA